MCASSLVSVLLGCSLPVAPRPLQANPRASAPPRLSSAGQSLNELVNQHGPKQYVKEVGATAEAPLAC